MPERDVPEVVGRRLAETRRVLADGRAEEAAERYAALLAEAERHGLVPEQAAALLGLGECALETGELHAARGHFEQAEAQLSGETLPVRVPAVRGRAVAHYLAGEIRYAVHLLESALDELDRGGPHDPDALLHLYTAVIGPYMDLGAHARAAQAAEFALALTPRAADPALIARTHRAVARTLLAEGRYAEADASLAEAAELYRRLRLRTELANCHWMRGYVHAQAGELERAETELRQALEMLAQTRAALYRSQAAVELADVLHRRGRPAEATALLDGVLGDFSAERGALHAAAAHRLLGIIAEDADETDSAEEHYVRALSLLERAGAAGDLADLCRLLGDLLRRTGRTEAALDAYRTGLGHRTTPGTTTLGPAPTGPLF
ncbi:tetratricopeptide repeat protein [Streptomyces sp. NPDC090119]|uniref:tetratricopeptide repeat protein n=1 Tax=Streptomyces sp. NPDC090119 TaxID=3365951 RepID=UPI00382AFB29